MCEGCSDKKVAVMRAMREIAGIYTRGTALGDTSYLGFVAVFGMCLRC